MNYGKRGMALENMIEYTNNIYKLKGVALVDKVPTPWNVHYDKRSGRVVRAFPQKKGTVDFVGISNGRSIAFDAKSTKERTRFPLSNVEQHQVEYLLNHQKQGGISFLIIFFEKHNEAYFMPINKFLVWWEGQFTGGRKSIPYDWFKSNVDLIQSKNGVPLDYLTHCKIQNNTSEKGVVYEY